MRYQVVDSEKKVKVHAQLIPICRLLLRFRMKKSGRLNVHKKQIFFHVVQIFMFGSILSKRIILIMSSGIKGKLQLYKHKINKFVLRFLSPSI
jgi:hypothetical protein